MKKVKVALSILCLVVSFLSCSKDDGGNANTPVELRDRAEQQIADNDSIVKYLKAHYYNSSVFEGNSNPNISQLVITKLGSDGTVPTDHKLLWDAVENSFKDLTFSEANYKVYYLNLNPLATGESPNFADQVRVNYEGFTLSNKVFDSAVTPVDFDLTSLVPGWRKVLPLFKSAIGAPVIGSDGSVNYTNHGVGVMFLPSGLAYFNNATAGIPAYTPIAFKFDLFQTSVADHDNDGIPSYLEDLNGDGELFDENTDGDFNSRTRLPIFNYLDADDDGDGVLTKDEIVIKTYNKATKAAVESIELASNEELVKILKEVDGTFTGTTVTFTDTDTSDDIPDYLDKNN